MRIGIITFHRPENFGSALQAFALREYLAKMGHDSSVIDFVFPRDLKQYRLFRIHVYLKRPWSILGDLVYLKRNLQRKLKFSRFRRQYLNMTKSYVYGKDDLSVLNEDFDAFVCGSDQIWNLDCTGGVVPEYFLGFANDDKLRISYAPSMPQKPLENEFQELRKYLDRFDYISVREKNTKTFFEDVLGLNQSIEHVLDPTLLLEAKDYIEKFALRKKAEKYIFVYVLGYTDIKKSIAKEANRKKSETGLPIKYVMVRRLEGIDDGEYLLGIGPTEFLDYIYNAAYVITDSFHASVFSIIFGIPFCTYAREGTSSRMQELLYNLDLASNYCEDNKTGELAYTTPSNKTACLLKEYRHVSYEYLENCVK